MPPGEPAHLQGHPAAHMGRRTIWRRALRRPPIAAPSRPPALGVSPARPVRLASVPRRAGEPTAAVATARPTAGGHRARRGDPAAGAQHATGNPPDCGRRISGALVRRSRVDPPRPGDAVREVEFAARRRGGRSYHVGLEEDGCGPVRVVPSLPRVRGGGRSLSGRGGERMHVYAFVLVVPIGALARWLLRRRRG